MGFWDRFLAIVKPDKHKVQSLPNLGKQKHSNAQFDLPMSEITKSLRQSIAPAYVKLIKQGLQARKEIRAAECENRWFEWKRFLVMSTQIPSIQMYSSAVDEVWHEMLRSTDKYETFCERFFHGFFDHLPHTDSSSVAKLEPYHREWFELIYLILFQQTPYTPVAWRYFFGRPLPLTVLTDLREQPKEVLYKKYFSLTMHENVPHAKALSDFIIDYLVSELNLIETHIAKYGKRSRKKLGKILKIEESTDLMMLRTYLFLSRHHQKHYQKYKFMVGGRRKNARDGGCGSGSCSSCSVGGSCGGGGGGCGGGS